MRNEKIEELIARTKHQGSRIETLEHEYQALERNMELKVAALQEKSDALNEILRNEKDARETWADRYEKE